MARTPALRIVRIINANVDLRIHCEIINANVRTFPTCQEKHIEKTILCQGMGNV